MQKESLDLKRNECIEEIKELYTTHKELDFCRVCINYGDRCVACDKNKHSNVLESELILLFRKKTGKTIDLEGYNLTDLDSILGLVNIYILD